MVLAYYSKASKMHWTYSAYFYYENDSKMWKWL